MNIRKRLFSMVLVTITVFTVMSSIGLPIYAQERQLLQNTVDFAGGNGTFADPYLISAKAHLNNVRNYPDAYFLMINDILFNNSDFASGGAFYNAGTGWESIGTDNLNAFTGVFNGDGFKIQGLKINITSGSNASVGLFGYTSGTIRDVGLADSIISSSSSYTGGIAGYNSGTITNCYNTGSITSVTNSFTVSTGGIVGYNGGIIENCFNTGFITADASSSGVNSNAGGIAGVNYGGTITKSYNTGSVTANANATYTYSYAGGITGNDTGTITKCYNTGSVTASSYAPAITSSNAGGITGDGYGAAIENCCNMGSVTVNSASSSYHSNAGGIAGINSGYGIVKRCYNTGSVTGTSAYFYAGGIIGSNQDSSVEYCYYLDDIPIGVGDGADTATQCTSAQMLLQGTFVEFNFFTVWEICTEHPEHLYPLLSEVPYPKYFTGISITSLPNKTSYIVGELFDSTGMVIAADYSDGFSEAVTSWTATSTPLILGQTEIAVSYMGKTAMISITVSQKPILSGQISVGDVKGKPNKTVDVTVSIYNNPGVVMMLLTLNYDKDILKLVGVSNNNSIFSDALHGGDFNIIPYNMSWVMMLGVENNNTNNGLLVTLSFEIINNTAPCETPVIITYAPIDILDTNYEQIPFNIQNGKVTILPMKTPGDVSGDGEISLFDALLLRQYLVGGYNITSDDIDIVNSDVNCDDEISLIDLLLLRQYVLVGYSIDISDDGMSLCSAD